MTEEYACPWCNVYLTRGHFAVPTHELSGLTNCPACGEDMTFAKPILIGSLVRVDSIKDCLSVMGGGEGHIPDGIYGYLAEKYYGRLYHSLEHIDRCLAEVEITDDVRSLSTTQQIVLKLAIWFHDAIYNPTRQDNEERSALVAEASLCSVGVLSPVTDRVKDLIMATKHTGGIPTNYILEQIITDIDLVGLADPYRAFLDTNNFRIRKEFSHLSDEQYRKGHSEFFRSLMARRTIYYRESFITKYELLARDNITRYLKESK